MNQDAKIYVAGHRGLVGSAILRKLKERGYRNLVVQTSQELDLRRQERTEAFFEKERPDCILVQGDTTTTFAASLAAFYLKIPVGHVEAGLRTRNKYNPYPEEINRQLTSRITEFHFAPTVWAKKNLLAEGVNESDIFVTGNTVIDALLMIVDPKYTFQEEVLNRIDYANRRVIVLTSHRRENFGEPMRNIFTACKHLVERNPDVELVYPVHPNPNVRSLAYEILDNIPRVHLIEPLGYRPFVQLMNKSFLILTDSGGVQEETCILGTPCVTLRDNTERPETLGVGSNILAGVEPDRIIQSAVKMMGGKKSWINPFGNGRAAEKIIDALRPE